MRLGAAQRGARGALRAGVGWLLGSGGCRRCRAGARSRLASTWRGPAGSGLQATHSHRSPAPLTHAPLCLAAPCRSGQRLVDAAVFEPVPFRSAIADGGSPV